MIRFLVVGCTAIAGCTADNTFVVAPTSPATSAVAAAEEHGDTLAEEPLQTIADDYPTFAGLFIEAGKLVVLTTDGGASQAENIIAASRSFVAGGVNRGHKERERVARNVELRTARFSFGELLRWKQLIREPVLDVEGVVSFGLDEAANVLKVRVEPSADVNTVAAIAREAGVPAAALRVLPETKAELLQFNLNSRIRPLTAGYRYAKYWTTAAPPSYTPTWYFYNLCTLGVPAIRQQVQVLLIVSHCTHKEGALDSSPTSGFYIGQDWSTAVHGATGWFPPAPPGYNPFGQEVFDRAGWNCGVPTRKCRHAEVAAWDLYNIEVLPGETPFQLGRIARPEYPVPGNNTSGHTVNIDPAYPHFTIVGEVLHPVQGESVHKVGLTTGWSYGFVVDSCEDVNYSGGGVARRAMCQTRSSLGGEPGDSGSPVFSIVDLQLGTVRFVGLVSGKGSAGTWGPSVQQLRGELGSFQVY